VFFVASRGTLNGACGLYYPHRMKRVALAPGHHADIGGISPGSMPPFSKYLYQEGAAMMTFKLVSGGEFDEKGITEVLMSPAKVPQPGMYPQGTLHTHVWHACTGLCTGQDRPE